MARLNPKVNEVTSVKLIFLFCLISVFSFSCATSPAQNMTQNGSSFERATDATQLIRVCSDFRANSRKPDRKSGSIKNDQTIPFYIQLDDSHYRAGFRVGKWAVVSLAGDGMEVEGIADKDEIRSSFVRSQNRLKECFLNFFDRSRPIPSVVYLEFSVEGAWISDKKVSAAKSSSNQLSTCLLKSLDGIEPPKSKKGNIYRVKYPMYVCPI